MYMILDRKVSGYDFISGATSTFSWIVQASKEIGI
jgi:hypothetical protein